MQHTVRSISHSCARNIYKNSSKTDWNEKKRLKSFCRTKIYNQKADCKHQKFLPSRYDNTAERIFCFLRSNRRLFCFRSCYFFRCFRMNHFVDTSIFSDILYKFTDRNRRYFFRTFYYSSVHRTERGNFRSVVCKSRRTERNNGSGKQKHSSHKKNLIFIFCIV